MESLLSSLVSPYAQIKDIYGLILNCPPRPLFLQDLLVIVINYVLKNGSNDVSYPTCSYA